MKDFFVSYNGADVEKAKWVADVLKAAGYSVVLQAQDFHAGSDFVVEMHQAAIEAKRTIAVLSPDYLKAPFPQSEWAAAFAQDPTGEKRQLVPVRVRKCQPPGLLRSRVYIDLVGLADDAARDKLLAELKGQPPAAAAPDRSVPDSKRRDGERRPGPPHPPLPSG